MRTGDVWYENPKQDSKNQFQLRKCEKQTDSRNRFSLLSDSTGYGSMWDSECANSKNNSSTSIYQSNYDHNGKPRKTTSKRPHNKFPKKTTENDNKNQRNNMDKLLRSAQTKKTRKQSERPGHSSVDDHSNADREVPGSNPGA
uniref:Ovule protein n=1 Tax=Syphacia muris TaxID=451379 RepID=A0A0N5AAS7_9BILA